MPLLTFIDADGVPTQLEVAAGTSAMVAALTHGVDGILGECGGELSCATCHVFVREPRTARQPPAGSAEDALLDATASPRTHRSRLACQLIVSEDSEFILELPDRQD